MIKIGTIDKDLFLKTDVSSFSLEQNNYKVMFHIDRFIIESISSKESNVSFFKKILDSLKRKVFNIQLASENMYPEQKSLSINFMNSNSENGSYIKTNDDNTLIYYNIYNGINLECTTVDNNLICNFTLSKNCNPREISMSFNGNSTIVLDENNNLRVNLNESNIIFKKPLFNNKEIDYKLEQNISLNLVENNDYEYVLEGNKVYLIPSEDNTYIESEGIVTQSDNDELEIKIQSDPYDPSTYTNSKFIGQRKLTIPISKSKFKYPRDYTTSLISSFSVPIIEELLVNRNIKQLSSSYNICDSSQPPITVFTSYNVDTIIPTVCFSVVLYKEPYPDTSNINYYDGVFGYIEDSFVANSFDICNTAGDEKYYPVDYTFVPIADKEINYTSENNEYYFYSVTLDLYIYPTPPIKGISSEVSNILNGILGKNPDDPITPGELSQIETLDLNSTPSVIDNPSIFEYMPNLKDLNLSSCNINSSFLTSLSSLPKLESLDISGNPITDLSLLPTSLASTLKCLDCSFNQSIYPPCETAYTSLLRTPISKIIDVSYLAVFTKLETLKLDEQAISDISSLNNLILQGNLKALLVRNQDIYKGDIYPTESICSSYCDFSLELDFIKNIDSSIPTILCISDYGYCYSTESGICYPCDSCDSFENCGDLTRECICDNIIWEDITTDTEEYFTFKSDSITLYPEIIYEFSGVVNVNLVIND
ncbi:MAG: hypothetical protein ACRC92_15175 [Peptostreptococcaceae bacterium]